MLVKQFLNCLSCMPFWMGRTCSTAISLSSQYMCISCLQTMRLHLSRLQQQLMLCSRQLPPAPLDMSLRTQHAVASINNDQECLFLSLQVTEYLSLSPEEIPCLAHGPQPPLDADPGKQQQPSKTYPATMKRLHPVDKTMEVSLCQCVFQCFGCKYSIPESIVAGLPPP